GRRRLSVARGAPRAARRGTADRRCGAAAVCAQRPVRHGMTGRPDADWRWLLAAVELSRSCPVVDTAYAVGAIIVGADGREVSRGYSRETNPTEHAEEAALHRAV